MLGQDELVIVVPPGHKWARRGRVVTARELAATSLVAREPHSGIRDSLTVALRQVLGDDMEQAPPVLELTSAAAMRAAVLAGAGPAAMSRLAVADDLAVGRLRAITIPELDLRRKFRAIWVGGRTPPAGAIRDLALAAAFHKSTLPDPPRPLAARPVPARSGPARSPRPAGARPAARPSEFRCRSRTSTRRRSAVPAPKTMAR